MRLLALETATAGAGLALADDERVLAEIALGADRAVSEQLLPALDALLSLAGADRADLEAFAISIGPGSFTGLRVGLATLKGLAFGSTCPVAPVPTLAVLAAAAAPARGPVAALLDARRGEVYAAAYHAAGDLEPGRLAEGVYPIEELATRLPAGCTVVGEGALLHRDLLEARGLDVAGPAHARARAGEVARLGLRLLAAGAGVPVAELAPRYLRRAEAEVRRTGQRLEPPA